MCGLRVKTRTFKSHAIRRKPKMSKSFRRVLNSSLDISAKFRILFCKLTLETQRKEQTLRRKQ